MNIHRIINQCHRLSRQLLLTAVALTLLTACDTQAEYIPLLTDTTYESVEFELPSLNYDKYQVLVNGEKAQPFYEKGSKLDIEILYDGKVIYTGTGLEIPEDRTFRFYFVEVLGHGLMNLPENLRHSILVTVDEPFEGMKLLLKGMEGHPNGLALDNETGYILDQSEVQKGNLSVEIYQGDQLLWSDKVLPETTETLITLVGNPEEGLLALTPPSEEMREQLVEKYDTWMQFMFSAKDYPGIETLVVEFVPSSYFVDPFFPEEFKEGKKPIKIELTPEKPSGFMLFNSFEENDVLYLYKVYDLEKPDEILVFGKKWMIFNENRYNRQGEDNYKFRTYKLVPKGSPEIPQGVFVFFEPYPAYKKAYSFP